ncbi:MAG: polysaccharide deacetylase family protein [Spirochaetales bacterium]|nr:polysaccharide deacetylase family protein [Spirochaetales bacterium]
MKYPKVNSYLTIDDAPCEKLEKKIDFLEKHHIKAIWFCCGKDLKQYPELAEAIIQAGHVLANHSMDHGFFSELTVDEARYQILECDNIIEEIYSKAGIKRPGKFFRFPYLDNGQKADYGRTDWQHPHVMAIQKILKNRGYEHPPFKNINHPWYKQGGFDRCINVDCSYDSRDWALAAGNESFGFHSLDDLVARLEQEFPSEGRDIDSNEIVLTHAWVPFDIYSGLIKRMLEKSFHFILPEIL